MPAVIIVVAAVPRPTRVFAMDVRSTSSYPPVGLMIFSQNVIFYGHTGLLLVRVLHLALVLLSRKDAHEGYAI
jgi:hypothetical protein